MESPTTDISIGMEALRLGLTDQCVSESTTQQSAASSPIKKADNLTSFQAPMYSKETSSHDCTISPPQFGISQTTQNPHKHTQYRSNVRLEPNSKMVCTCTNQATDCLVCQRLRTRGQEECQSTISRTDEEIADSFNSLQVTTDPPHSVAGPVLPHRTISSCRQQEAVYSNYSGRYNLDDTTVDELAGYFEEMMYLPKPMSEMAELMYT